MFCFLINIHKKTEIGTKSDIRKEEAILYQGIFIMFIIHFLIFHIGLFEYGFSGF